MSIKSSRFAREQQGDRGCKSQRAHGHMGLAWATDSTPSNMRLKAWSKNCLSPPTWGPTHEDLATLGIVQRYMGPLSVLSVNRPNRKMVLDNCRVISAKNTIGDSSGQIGH